jgi:ABC-type dipeptide/oligopeptide/nickel transport system ATPase component
MEILKTENICIMGRKGSGKTTVARKLIRLANEQVNFDHIYINDPMDQFEDLATPYYDIEQIIKAHQSGERAFRYVRGTPTDALLLLEYLREIDNILLVFDEADQLFTASNLQNPESMLWFNDYGRHAGMGIIMIARRPQKLPRDVTAQCVLFFQPSLEPNDMLYIKSRVGFHPDPLPKYHWYMHTADGELRVITADYILN